MKRPLIFLLVVLAVILGVLATLQYSWIDRVSDAERQQLRANIEFAGRVFADELTRELAPLVRSFEAHEDVAAAHPKLVQAAYFVEHDDDSWILDDGIAITPWPKELTFLRQRLETMAQDAGAGPPPHPPGPFLADVPALLLVERRGAPARDAGFDGGGPPPGRGGMFPRIVLVLLKRDALQYEVLPWSLAGQDVLGRKGLISWESGVSL
ncbi:MAG: hypothetical protein M3P06_22915 [Acidobacteriota bacterium]|nr:hypothetical protein [Acidobacteriota bacterium]